MRFILWGDSQLNAMTMHILKHYKECAARKKPLVVTISEKEDIRRVEQNKRYWAIVNEFVLFMHDAGVSFDAETWHEYFKRMFIGVKELPNGEKIGLSSTKLSVLKFAEFSEQVEAWMAQEYGFSHTYGD